jgi:hypothetical protein
VRELIQNACWPNAPWGCGKGAFIEKFVMTFYGPIYSSITGSVLITGCKNWSVNKFGAQDGHD